MFNAQSTPCEVRVKRSVYSSTMGMGEELLKRLQHVQRAKGWNETDLAVGELGITNGRWSNWKRRGEVAKDGYEAALKVLNKYEPSLPAKGTSSGGRSAAVKSSEHVTSADDGSWRDVLGYAQAVGLGKGAEAAEYAEVHKLKFKTSSLKKKGLIADHQRVFYGSGDSMKEVQHGDAIMFDSQDTVPKDGEIYVLFCDGEYQCKKAMILDGVVYFYATNPDGAPSNWKKPRRADVRRSPIEVVGHVNWIGRWLA